MKTKTQTIHARVEPRLKANVEKVLEKLGLTTTEAIRLYFRQIELRQGLPFEVRIPNAKTSEVFASTDRGEDLTRSKDAAEMFKKLGI